VRKEIELHFAKDDSEMQESISELEHIVFGLCELAVYNSRENTDSISRSTGPIAKQTFPAAYEDAKYKRNTLTLTGVAHISVDRCFDVRGLFSSMQRLRKRDLLLGDAKQTISSPSDDEG
jgi:hypothetical protein